MRAFYKYAFQAVFSAHWARLALTEQLFGFPCSFHPAQLPLGAGSEAMSCLGTEQEVGESRHQRHLAGAPNDAASTWKPNIALGEPRAPLQRRPEPFKEERGTEINCLLAFLPRPPSPPPPSPPPPHMHPIHPAGRWHLLLTLYWAIL